MILGLIFSCLLMLLFLIYFTVDTPLGLACEPVSGREMRRDTTVFYL